MLCRDWVIEPDAVSPRHLALPNARAILRFGRWSKAVGIDNESDQAKEGHSVDALALRGDEGRGTLR